MAGGNRYQILERLGSGAAGDVFLAADRLAGGHRVALKRIRARVDDSLRAAFEREFATMASISVPGVARVFDFGLEQDGEARRPYYTRSYVEGAPLDQAAEGQTLRRKVELVLGVAAVVAPLHRVGVIHGDLKPGNVIIDPEGRAHVIDFGLARVLGRDAQADGAGTPSFMSPELLRGEAASVQSDVYALGATLWCLLLGTPPHAEQGANALRARSRGALPSIPEGVTPETAAVLTVALRALSPDPMERLPTVNELAAALADAVQLEPQAGGRFVPPRAVGHEGVVAQLQAQVMHALAAPGATQVVLLEAPVGGGKTHLLQELKWRLQLRDHRVCALQLRSDSLPDALRRLLLRLSVELAEGDPVQAAAREAMDALAGGTLEAASVSESLCALLARVCELAPTVLVVDDLDRGEARFGELLRSAIHADAVQRLVLVAAASESTSPCVRALAPDEAIQVPALDAGQVRRLAAQALGSLDESVAQALYEHTQGLPASLVDALSALHTLSAPTPADVQALPQGTAGRAVALARMDDLSRPARLLLDGLSLLDTALARDRLGAFLSALGADAAAGGSAVAECEAHGLLRHDDRGLLLADASLTKALRQALGEVGLGKVAGRLLDADKLGLETEARALLAVQAGREEELKAVGPEAAARLETLGAFAKAAQLYGAVAQVARPPLRERMRLALARCHHSLGEHAEAERLAQELSESGVELELRVEAALVAGRALAAQACFDQAVERLSTLPADVSAPQRARLQRELAKVHLRRGDYDAASEAADAGLEVSDESDVVRIELLGCKGMVASYGSDTSAARGFHTQALELARRLGSRSAEANALTYLAIGHWRTGDFVTARNLLEQALEIARELGDVGSMANYSTNLGATLLQLGDPAGAAEHYESAARLSRRAGRMATRAQAQANLAHIHAYFGLYERAKLELAEVSSFAQETGHRYIAAQVAAHLGDIAAHCGHTDDALIRYDEAIALYRELGQSREVADHELDAGEALLERGGPADASAAAARLAAARARIEGEGLEDLSLRLDLLLSRGRVATGDAEGVIPALQQVLERAREARNPDLEWSALSAMASAHDALGSDFAARRYRRMSMEVLEDLALRIPREHRDAFWHDIRRRAVRAAAMRSEHGTAAEGPFSTQDSVGRTISDERVQRLLEIVKRLAGEHDLDRLLERITESAVDLSGAERGFVLLVDARGQIEAHTAREAGQGGADPHEAFSRSIAEAVLIDGEAIVTVDASHDGRLSEYVSVHKLMLRSVACLPIRGPRGTLGVLYLEHRRDRGRFSESAVELLNAFADQAAIALQNARLLEEVTRRQEDLEQSNQALEKAKRDLEEMLGAKTDALHEAHRELQRARKETSRSATRFGMLGRSPSMQRVFESIERLANANVPVVIRGESGTGKELVARAIHYEGLRAKAPFIAVNCGGMPETLLESELFGHVKGSFTGAERDRRGLIARASGGTLLLDEVGDMPAKMQMDLLRVLQEGTVCKVGGDQEEKVDVRFLAASHKSIVDLVEQGRFREDLYYRLNVVEVDIPPLRERPEDIPLLCDHYLDTFAKRDGRPAKRLSPEALGRLLRYSLPGNVRQLEHLLLQAWVMVDGKVIEAADLPLPDGQQPDAPQHGALPATQGSGDSGVHEVENLEGHKADEKRRILQALEASNWNRAKAAKTLGMARRTFYRRLQHYDIL